MNASAFVSRFMSCWSSSCPSSRLPLTELLGKPLSRRVALVGAGGKTSLLFALARLLVEEGERVICTTSTKIRPPRPEDCAEILLARPEGGADLPPLSAVRAALKVNGLVTVARRDLPEKALTGAVRKLEGLAPRTVDRLAEAFPDVFILVEADGAAGFPLKAPASHEPVVPCGSHTCIAIMGLDALGRPLDAANVHRAPLAAAMSGQRLGSAISLESFYRIAVHPEGLFRGTPAGCRRVVLLNKADVLARPDVHAGPDLFWQASQSTGAEPATGRAVGLADKKGPMWYLGSVRDGWCAPLAPSFYQPPQEDACP